MSFVKIWIHAVWTTKNREKLLSSEVRYDIFSHIHKNALEKGIFIDSVNGHLEHIHCLFRLRNDQTISKVMQLIKGESSFWINKMNLTTTKCNWQKEYYAVSVSESHVNKVRDYIMRQETHHRNKTFQREYEEFLKKYGFKING